MPEYQLEIKQTVDYPRCRIYRGFVQNLIADENLRTNKEAGLFHFTVLCSYANFRTSYRRLDGITYTVYPGEWVCRVTELKKWFRLHNCRQALSILQNLQDRRLIRFSMLGKDNTIVKFHILGWARFNTILDYNCPCQKDTGFFFLPVSIAEKLVSAGKCSEMDIVLDLWISGIFRDDRVQGSELGPVAYFRNGTGNPLVSYAELSERWSISKATVGRTMKKLSDQGYISLMTFPGRHGTVIYLENYLSTMFQISDVKVDKAEVALCLNIKIKTPRMEKACEERVADTAPEDKSSVSPETAIVSKSDVDFITDKALKVLENQGFSCIGCGRAVYKLYPLYDCKEEIEADTLGSGIMRYRLEVSCGERSPIYTFDMTITEAEYHKGGIACGK